MSKYSSGCMTPGCDHSFLVEAQGSEEALKKILEESKWHNYDFHPEMPILSEDKIKEIVLRSLKKVA